MELEEELRVVANNLKSLEVEYKHDSSHLEPLASNQCAGSNFLDRIVRGLWQQYRRSHHSIQLSLSGKTKASKMIMARWQRRRQTRGRSRTRRTSRT